MKILTYLSLFFIIAGLAIVLAGLGIIFYELLISTLIPPVFKLVLSGAGVLMVGILTLTITEG